MATATIPKSVMRIDHNVVVGYGEVPASDFEGILCWGFPGGEVTFSEEEAITMATQLDKEIRARLRDPNQLVRVM